MPKRRAELQVEVSEKTVKVKNADKVLTMPHALASADPEETVDFVVELDDIAHWDPPHQGEEIDIETLQKIVRAIEEEFDKLGLGIAFE